MDYLRAEMVPGVGLEPTQCFHRGILNPLRLPIRHPGGVHFCEGHSAEAPDQLQ